MQPKNADDNYDRQYQIESGCSPERGFEVKPHVEWYGDQRQGNNGRARHDGALFSDFHNPIRLEGKCHDENDRPKL